MGDGQTAVVEMARASGLALVPPRRRNPRITTTQGTGQIIKEALDREFGRIIVCLGGSATNDGGAGMAIALGARFLDEADCPIPAGGAALARLARVDASDLHPGLTNTTIVGATDVTNPLCGPTGASAIYGPQKGASPEVVAELDAALLNFAQVLSRDLGKDVADLTGAGAAGGLGAGLIAFAGAQLRSGIDMVCDVLGFDRHLDGGGLSDHRRGPGRPVDYIRQSPGGCGPAGPATPGADSPVGREPGTGPRRTVSARHLGSNLHR